MTKTNSCLRSSLGVLLALTAALSSAGVAQSQTADCSCRVPQASSPNRPIGQLVDVSGSNVMLSGSSGPAKAAAGASLHAADTLTVGPTSSAQVIIGDCSLQLAAQSEMTLSPTGGEICVAVNETGVSVGSTGVSVGPLAVFGALALGAAAVVVLDDGSDKPVSP